MRANKSVAAWANDPVFFCFHNNLPGYVILFSHPLKSQFCNVIYTGLWSEAIAADLSFQIEATGDTSFFFAALLISIWSIADGG